jgi:DNA-binding GntR family transcriptional regulator
MMSSFSERVKHLDFKPAVLVETLEQTLTDAIIEGVFQPGDKLVEADLQAQFGISRSPIRETFRVLEKKGLVEIIPRRGTFVKSISRRDIEEHFPVRSVLEGLAAREAYKRISAEQIAKMEQCLDLMKKAAAGKNAMKYFKQHFQFHEIFIQASGNKMLIDMLQNLRMHMLWYRFSYRYYQEDFSVSYRVHEKMVALYKDPKTNPDTLERIVREHIEVAVEKFVSYLEARE